MNRTGLLIALAIAAVAGVAFGLYPDLDLRIAGYFYSFEDAAHNKFAFRIYPAVLWARDIGLWIGTVLVIPAVISLVIKLILPRRKLLMSGRAIVFLMATMALAPGLLVNVVLKDHWGRSRPIDVTQFGGSEHFIAWWDPRGDCPANCAFVSGDVAGAFWTIAPAALAPPQWRAACARHRHGSGPCHGRRSFPVGCHFRRGAHVFGHMACLHPDLSLAADAIVR